MQNIMMANRNAKEVVTLYWQTLNVRLKLIWIFFGLMSGLHVTSKICELICPSSCLHWLAVTFIISFFFGMWTGLFLCFDENFNIVNNEKLVLWTKPLALGIQNLYSNENNNTQVQDTQNKDFHFMQLKDEIHAFEELIVRDFIHSWYDKYISGQFIFPKNVSSLMQVVVIELLQRLRKVNQEELLLHTLQEITKHLTIMEKSRHNLKKLKNTSQDKSQHFLVACYETFSVLHPAATSNDSELDYLRSILGAVFNCVLPKNTKICKPGVLLVREIICQAVLQQAIELICEPEFINDLVVMLADYMTSSKVLERDQMEESSSTEKLTSFQTQIKNQTNVGTVPKAEGEILEKNLNAKALEESCQQQKYSNKEISEYSLRSEYSSTTVVPNGFSFEKVKESTLKIQNTSHEYDITPLEKKDAETERETSLSSAAISEKKPYFQLHLGADEDNRIDLKSNDNLSGQSHLFEDISDLQIDSNLPKARTFSSFSYIMPVPLPKRAKSPALSNLSRSVDSVVDYEATPGELVSEPAKKKGHSRNSSYPNFIPSEEGFPDNEEGTESLVIPGSQDTIEHSASMPVLRDTTDGEEDSFCISNLRITSTTQMQEHNSKKTFVLYVVEFQVLAPGSLREEGAGDIELQVKRRYREFLTLHWKLDQKQELKKVLKNVKSAPKRFALPIMKKDTAAIKQRQVSLERYLKQLLDIPAIHSSPEMVEFLALKGNANIAFVQAATSYAPKFDQIIRRSLSEVKQGLKNLTPFQAVKTDLGNTQVIPGEKSSNSSQLVSEGGDEDQPVTTDQPLRICSVEQPKRLKSAMYAMPLVIEEALSGLELMIDALPEETTDPVHNEVLDPAHSDSSQMSSENPSYKKEGNISSQQDSPELPLYSSVVDIIGILQRDPEHWIFEENVSEVMKKLAGDFIQRYIYREVSVLLAPKSWALYLSLIREAIWPEGELYQSNGEVLSASEQMELFKKAENILLTSYPGILNILIGEDNMKDAISQLFESVQNKQLNKHLVYTFIDHLLELAIPEMKDDKFTDALMGQ